LQAVHDSDDLFPSALAEATRVLQPLRRELAYLPFDLWVACLVASVSEKTRRLFVVADRWSRALATTAWASLWSSGSSIMSVPPIADLSSLRHLEASNSEPEPATAHYWYSYLSSAPTHAAGDQRARSSCCERRSVRDRVSGDHPPISRA
jgi:hypothetical protein